MDRKDLIVNNVLKNISKDAKILEIYCGNGYSYKIINELQYPNYIGIDDDIKKIMNCKSMFINKEKFIYCENINEYLLHHKFDIIFCIGPCRNHMLTNVIKSAKCKIFYCISSTSDYSKLNLLSYKLNSYTEFTWKIFSSSERCNIIGTNCMASKLLDYKHLIIRDVCRGIINYMNKPDVLIEILLTIARKYTLCNLENVNINVNVLCDMDEDECVYIMSNKLNIIVPLIDNCQIEIDSDLLDKHVLDKGDIIIIDKLNYYVIGKCLQLVF